MSRNRTRDTQRNFLQTRDGISVICKYRYRLKSIEHYLKACAGKPDCTKMKMSWVISMSEQKISTDFTLVSLHIVTVSIDDHSLLDHLVWHIG